MIYMEFVLSRGWFGRGVIQDVLLWMLPEVSMLVCHLGDGAREPDSTVKTSDGTENTG